MARSATQKLARLSAFFADTRMQRCPGSGTASSTTTREGGLISDAPTSPSIRKELPSMNTLPKLTIVIPAKNESRHLPTLLESLCRQDYGLMKSTKVFMADAGSTDGTQELAMSFAGRLDIEVIPGGLPSVGRNAGARRASTPYVLFIDADMELRDTTLLRRAMDLGERGRLHWVTTNIWWGQGSAREQILSSA